MAVRRKTACGDNCATCKGGCEAREQVCIAENSHGAAVGDKVIIEIDSAKVLKSAFLVYILPILVFFAGFGILSQVGVSEGASAVFSVPFVAAVFLLLRRYDKKHGGEYDSKVVEII